MAQDYVAWHRSIWSDDDWRALTVGAQHLYELLVSHPDRNTAGMLPLTLRKWSKLARGLTVTSIRTSLDELDQAGFIVVDDDTEEVLVRSYIRRGEVYKHIRLLVKALRDIPAVESDRIRSAIGQELVRIPRLAIPELRPDGRNKQSIVEAQAAQECLDELASMLCDAPPDPPGNTAGQDAAHPMAHPMADGMPHPPGIGVGTGVGAGTGTAVGSCTSVEKKSLESNACAKPLTGLCAKHPGQPSRNCSGCAADRKAAS